MAGRSMGRKSKTCKTPSAEKVKLADRPGPLKRDDVQCPICWSILIEPVTPPCGHCLCRSCYTKHVQETSLQCPCCRTRLSVWSRKAFKENNLVDKHLWDRIQREFPKLVETRMLGEDSQDLMAADCVSLLDLDQNNVPTNGPGENNEIQMTILPLKRDGEMNTGKKGELKRELEEINRRHEEDIENRRKAEETESQELIRKLQEESAQAINNSEEEDILLATQLQEQEKTELCASINASRKLFTQMPESSDSLRTMSSFSGYEKTMPNTKSWSETPRKSPGGKRPSLSSLSGKRFCKKQKSGRLAYPSCSQTSSGKGSQNSILNYLSPSQQHSSPPESHASSRAIVNSPKPSTSAKALFQNQPKDSTLYSVSSFSLSSFVSLSAFSPRGIPAQVIPNTSIIYQSVLKPMNRKETGDKSPSAIIWNEVVEDSEERDIPTPNSIDVEVNSHFRPIRTAPISPPRKLPDGSFLPEPGVVKTTPVKLVPSIILNTSSLEENCSQMNDDFGGDAGECRTINCIPLERLQEPDEPRDSSPFDEKEMTLDLENSQHRTSDEEPLNESIESEPALTSPGKADNTQPLEQNSQSIDDEIAWFLCEEGVAAESQNVDLEMVREQARELELIIVRKKQEEEDRKFAKKLQKELNQPAPLRGDINPYGLRNWLRKSTSSGGEESSTRRSSARGSARVSNTVDDETDLTSASANDTE